MSGFDVHSLEAYSTIASVTGTNPDLTITVQTGDGAKFGNPQNVTIWPSGVQPTLANSTIGRISAISTDTLTVTTAQEGSSNITVSAGMQIANTITPKVLTDIESGGLLTTTALSATAGITSGQLAASGLNLPPAMYNPYKFNVYRNAAYTFAASAHTNPVPFDTKVFDTSDNFSTTTGEFTAPIAGFYQFNVTIGYASTSGNVYQMMIYQNGTGYYMDLKDSSVNTSQWMTASILIEAAVGDTFVIDFYNSAGSGPAMAVGLGNNSFSGFLVSAT